MQGVERYVLQRRDDVRSIRYDNVGSRLRDVTVFHTRWKRCCVNLRFLDSRNSQKRAASDGRE